MLRYPEEWVNATPPAVVERFAGVGNPFRLGPLPEGAVVLDVGAGAGFDAQQAARQVGPRGRVIGVDLTPAMVAKARAGAAARRSCTSPASPRASTCSTTATASSTGS